MRVAVGFLLSGLLAPILAGGEGAGFAPGDLVREYCLDCHDARRGEGGLDFGRHLDDAGRADPVADYRLWYRVADEVAAGRMPPEDEYRPPRAEAESWARKLRARLDRHAARHDGAVDDVPLRRVSNAEYASLVRRATGLGLDGAFAGLPVDPALGAGFRNHALAMTATHLEEFVAIADRVARHALLLEDRIAFAEREVVDVNAREALLEARVRAVHRRYRTDDGRLPLAAHLAALGDAALAEGCSPHYQQHLRTWLAAHREGPIGTWVVTRLARADGDPKSLATLADAMLALSASLARDLPSDGVRAIGRSWRDGGARRFLRVAPEQLRDALRVRMLVTPHGSRMPPRAVWEDGALRLFSREVGFHAAVWGEAECTLRLADPVLVPRGGDPATDAVGLRDALPAAPDGCRWDGDALVVPAAAAPGRRRGTRRRTRRARRRVVGTRRRRGPARTDRRTLRRPAHRARRRRGDPRGPGLPPERPDLVLARPPPTTDAPDRGRRVARRLALALWGAPPDTRLRHLAAEGGLDDDAVLAAEVRRLAADPRADFFVENCLGRWLGWADLSRRPSFDRDAWPAVDDALLAQMRASCRRTVGEALRRDRPVAELLETPWRWLTPELAAHEGRELDGEGWHLVAHDGGLLSLPGLLAPLTTGARGSVVRRGAWVHRDLLGRHLPRPLEGVDPLPEEHPGEPVGIRDRLAAHMDRASCRACHGRFDRYGFAFESLDGVGRPRDGAEIDDLVILPDDAEVRGLAGLREYLGAHRVEVVERALRQVLGYALGRRIVLSDEPLIARTLETLRRGEGRWSELLVAVFTSPQWTGKGAPR